MRIFCLAITAATLTSCLTLHAVDPKPTVAVSAEDGSMVVDVSTTKDEQVLDRITILEFHKTLENGFKNAVGDSLAPEQSKATLKLKIEQADLTLANMGRLGRALNIRYRATWYDRGGTKLTSVAGIATPRNPMETSARHLEDVVEVMYEQIVEGLERARGIKTRQQDRT